MDARVSQVVVEVMDSGPGTNARAGQLAPEVLRDAPANRAHVGQVVPEVLRDAPPNHARVGQLVVEVVVPFVEFITARLAGAAATAPQAAAGAVAVAAGQPADGGAWPVQLFLQKVPAVIPAGAWPLQYYLGLVTPQVAGAVTVAPQVAAGTLATTAVAGAALQGPSAGAGTLHQGAVAPPFSSSAPPPGSSSAAPSSSVFEAVDATPDDLFLPASALCSLGLRPQLLTGFLVDHLRRHFAARAGIEAPQLRDSLWMIGDATGITIESATRWVPGRSQERPAILVRRNDMTNLSLGIADRMMGGFQVDNSAVTYETFWQGSHTLFCLAHGDGAAAELLAAEVYRDLVEFRDPIRDSLLLHKFAVAVVGAPAQLRESTDTYAVPITVGYVFDENWRITPQKPRLKRIDIVRLIDIGV